MAELPGALCPWVETRFLKTTDEGLVPNSAGFVRTRATDLTTDQATFTTSDVNPATGTPHSNPILLDASGRPPSGIYLMHVGYSFYVYDSDMTLLYSIPYVSDVGSAFLATQANIQTEGTDATTSPYVVVASDNLVTVSSATTPFVVQLPAAADRGTPLIIKNLSNITLRVTPSGAETLETLAAYYSVGAASSPNFPTITLLSDGVSNWVVSSSHGL